MPAKRLVPTSSRFTVSGPRQTATVAGGKVSTRTTFFFNTNFIDEMVRDKKVQAAFEKLAGDVEADAKRRVHTITYALQQSISADYKLARGVSGEKTIRIELTAGGPDAPYWAFEEFGFGQRGRARPGPKGLVGLPTGYTFGSVPGREAHPYLRPAIMNVRKRLRDAKGSVR